MASSILIVDDEPSALNYLRVLLEESEYSVRATANGVEALIAMEIQSYDLVISDIRMPRMDGLELLNHLQERWPACPVIVLTANEGVEDIIKAIHLGAINYIIKPASAPVVLAAVEKALRARPRRDAPSPEVSELIGQSPPIVEVRHRTVMAARSDVHVIVTGDTGTGKELVARSIHSHSTVADGPFVAHNCALSPPELFESEFFGHRRGSFTGAERDRLGLLEEADGGVLFLDELETMLPAHQAKLLRVIDDGEVRPVGSEAIKNVSVRFVAATNRDPLVMIAEGTLREDLYYRLRGVEIMLPPMSDRVDDIPLLAEHFLADPDGAGFTTEAMDRLMNTPWPGNVRQLRNIVQGARAAAGQGLIGVEHLSLDPRVVAPATSRGGEVVEPSRAGSVPRGVTLRELERRAIEQALEDCNGNRTQAAKQLDIDRSTLRRKIQEFEID